jgi:Glycosyl transferase family 2
MNRQVNFLLIKGGLTPCYRRAILTAKVHDAPIVLWCAGDRPDVSGLDVELRLLELPAWAEKLQNPAHLYDVLAWKIGYEQGGLVLGLDTISVKPAWDLMTIQDLVVSTDWELGNTDIRSGNMGDHRFNNNFLARKGSPIILEMYKEAERRAIYEKEIWGYTGPCLITDFIKRYPKYITGAPYPALCGLSSGYVWRFYLGLEEPGPDVRVIHLCSQNYLALYERRFEDWARANPVYAYDVANRNTVNDALIWGESEIVKPAKNKPTIALVIMVKNEKKTLPRTLASVAGIADKIIALDTGSTDGTLKLLKEAGADILESPFKSFGESRTELLKFAKGKADWLLMLDADWTLEVDPGLQPIHEYLNPEVRVYGMQHTGPLSYWQPHIIRGDLDWEYKGVCHEYLARSEAFCKFFGVKVAIGAESAEQWTVKLERNLKLLKAEYAKDTKNSRTVFYLARTLNELGRTFEARHFFLERAKMFGWEEEVFVSKLEAARISMDPTELWECWASRPTRAEPLFWLSRAYIARDEIMKAIQVNQIRSAIPVPADILFVDTPAYGPEAKAIP